LGVYVDSQVMSAIQTDVLQWLEKTKSVLLLPDNKKWIKCIELKRDYVYVTQLSKSGISEC